MASAVLHDQTIMKFRFKIAPLPAHFRGTWQTFLDALIDRLEITSDASPFVISADAPAGNRGPWFKNGTQLWVWSEETSAYVGIDLTASYTAQVWISETAPDNTKYDVWVKLSGNTVVGLFTFIEDLGEWVTKDLTIGPGTITTAKLADGAVTPIKIRTGDVSEEKIAGQITIDHWSVSDPGNFVKMSYTGSDSNWYSVLTVSPELPVVAESITRWEHGLGRIPHMARAFLVCKHDDAGFTAGTEVEYRAFYTWFAAASSLSFCKTPTELSIQTGLGLGVVHPGDIIGRNITPGKWKLKFYLTAQ